MSELLPVLEAMLSEVDAGRAGALCTVVRASGSTPQCPGAALLLRFDFTTLGTLGGGCVEAEVKRRAFELLQAGGSALLDFDLDHDYGWDDGLLCGGSMTIGVTTVAERMDLSPFRQAVERLRRREAASFPLAFEREGERRQYRVHLEVPPTLLIAGAGHVGQAVAKLAVDLDFHVVVIDDRADCASRERFGADVELIVGDIAQTLRGYPIDDGCYVVIVTRGHRHDQAALEAVIRGPARYIGMIGSRRKVSVMFAELVAAGVPRELVERVHSPIGLPIRAITVAEIAVSIMAEVVQVRRERTPKLVEETMEERRR